MWPALKTTTTHTRACAKFGQKVFIGGESLSSTEVLDLVSHAITVGGDMASPRKWFHLATIRRGGEEMLFAVGGQDSSTSLSSVEKWVEERATWRSFDNLAEEKALFGAVALPIQLVCPA